MRLQLRDEMRESYEKLLASLAAAPAVAAKPLRERIQGYLLDEVKAPARSPRGG